MKSWTQAWREAREQQIALNPNDPSGGQFIWQDKIYSTRLPFDQDIADPDYVLKENQSIWLREEISIAQELADLAPQFKEEFLANNTGFDQGDFADNPDLATPVFSALRTSVPDSQLVESIKYVFKPRFDVFPENKKYVYPTLYNYLKDLGDNCMACSYAVLMPSVLNRQMAIENTENKFVRIYVPLIVPEDNFLELEGIEISYGDIFAIDTTLMHSEHNLSEKPRLVLMLDVSREHLGLPPGDPYEDQRAKHIGLFVRGALAKIHHTLER
jgi:hypothetical protein